MDDIVSQLHVLLTCGCRAMSLGRKAGEPESARRPACPVHDCFDVAEAQPQLTDRVARCAYFGRGRFRNWECNYSKQTGCTRERCRCEVPSSLELPFFKHVPTQERDEFYCGCAGWD